MRIALVVVLLLSLATSGCPPLIVAAAVGAGAAAGARELVDVAVTYKGNINSVENAVRKALKNLGASANPTVAGLKPKERTIKGATHDGEILTIDLRPTSPSSTLVDIRVGRMGSVPRAQEIHQAIQKYAKVK
jgi:hypothetical protein